MPSVFDSRFKASGFPILLQQFGEEVRYVPISGSSRIVNAIVEREPPATYDRNGNVILYKLRIRVTNDSTLGITNAEVVEGQDTISVPQRVDDASPSVFSIQVLESQDSGVSVFGLM